MKLMMQAPPRLPVDDYSAALRDAVSWLGERYLLAVPVTRSEQATPRSRIVALPDPCEKSQ